MSRHRKNHAIKLQHIEGQLHNEVLQILEHILNNNLEQAKDTYRHNAKNFYNAMATSPTQQQFVQNMKKSRHYVPQKQAIRWMRMPQHGNSSRAT